MENKNCKRIIKLRNTLVSYSLKITSFQNVEGFIHKGIYYRKYPLSKTFLKNRRLIFPCVMLIFMNKIV